MKISELSAGQGKVELQAKVTEKGDIRTFEKFGKEGTVCNAVLTDDSGSIKLTLWNEQTEEVKSGDTIKISNGYVSEFRDELQLGTGKFGQLEVVSSNGASDATADELDATNITETKAAPVNEDDFVDVEEEKF